MRRKQSKGWEIVGVVMLFVATLHYACSNGAAQQNNQGGNTNPATGNTGTANGNQGGWQGRFGNQGAGNIGGGMANRPGAGFYVSATLASGTSTGSGTYTAGGFEITCDKADTNQITMDLSVHIKKADGVQEYDTDTSFKSACIDAAKIVYNNLYTGDEAVLTVTIKDTNGKTIATGVSDSFTQAATAMPQMPPQDSNAGVPPADGSQTTQRPQFQRPEPQAVNITMKNVTSTSTVSSTSTSTSTH